MKGIVTHICSFMNIPVAPLRQILRFMDSLFGQSLSLEMIRTTFPSKILILTGLSFYITLQLDYFAKASGIKVVEEVDDELDLSLRLGPYKPPKFYSFFNARECDNKGTLLASPNRFDAGASNSWIYNPQQEHYFDLEAYSPERVGSTGHPSPRFYYSTFGRGGTSMSNSLPSSQIENPPRGQLLRVHAPYTNNQEKFLNKTNKKNPKVLYDSITSYYQSNQRKNQARVFCNQLAGSCKEKELENFISNIRIQLMHLHLVGIRVGKPAASIDISNELLAGIIVRKLSRGYNDLKRIIYEQRRLETQRILAEIDH
ncbi:hypothetical protein O181_038423 [Austropuccinia psidii MF-1]|uniref:Uncharacterized protein n=1 Tax=Austropuccinia psidii MF-1 TaxID=1389203 RepID=A0A9Q3DBE3_9BASI|nr:hypothetical protein [Austropuccinia psidii MF-1]